MLRYILTFMFLFGCHKKVQTTEMHVNERIEFTCEENPLFCEDFDDNDLPEYGEETDTGD